MKQIISFVKKYLGELLAIIGTGISTYNIFNFSYNTSTGSCSSGLNFNFGGETAQKVAYYYYTDGIILLITIGAMLIVLGVIIMRRK